MLPILLGLVVPLCVRGSGWWTVDNNFDGPWYNSLFTVTPTADNPYTPLNFTDACPITIPLAPLSSVNGFGSLHVMSDANGTSWNGYNTANEFEYFEVFNDVFLTTGASSVTSVTQLYDAFITYATDNISGSTDYGSALPDDQSSFAGTLVEFYKTSVNPCFFDVHVWNQYKTDPDGMVFCSLAQDPASPWSEFPFAIVDLSATYPSYSPIFLTLQLLAGTFLGSADSSNSCPSSQTSAVWSTVGAVPAVNRLFTCSLYNDCGPFANTVNQSASSSRYENNWCAYDVRYQAATGIRRFVGDLSNTPYFEYRVKDVGTALVSDGLFLNQPRFLVRSNDNARQPMEFSHSAAKGTVQRSFPPTPPSGFANVCYNSPLGRYNDATHTGNHTLVAPGPGNLCFYAYNEVYGNTAEPVIALAGPYVSGAASGNNTLDYLHGRETGTPYSSGLQPIRSLSDCLASGAAEAASGYDFCPTTGISYCLNNNAEFNASAGYVQCNNTEACPSMGGMWTGACPVYHPRFNRRFDTNITMPALPSAAATGFCVERVSYDATVDVGIRQVLCVCNATDTPCNAHPGLHQCYNASFPDPTCGSSGYVVATRTPLGTDPKPAAPSLGDVVHASVGNASVLVDFDPVHCALVETPGYYAQSPDNVVQQPSTLQFQRKIAEKPLFLDPRPAVWSGNAPLGLTREQLETWCGCATSAPACDGSRDVVRYHLCYFNYTLNACTLRMMTRDYIADLTTRTVATTTVPNPVCNTWVPELHEPYQCQRPDAFTGCVLVASQPIGNAYYTTSTTSGSSLRVPNTLDRLSVFPRVSTVIRTYVTMYAFRGQCLYRGAFPRYKPTLNPMVQTTYPCEPSGTLTCRYVDAYGRRANLTVDLNAASPVDPDSGVFNASVLGGALNITTAVFAELYTATDTATIALECDPATAGTYTVVFAPPVMVNGQYFSQTYNHSTATVVGGAPLLARSCVPLTWKIPVNATSYQNQIEQGHLYRTSPTNCVAVENQLIPEDVYGSAVNDTTAMCRDRYSQLEWLYTELPCQQPGSSAQYTNALNIASNIPVSTAWFSIMRAYGYGAYFFDLSTDPTSVVPGTGECQLALPGTYPGRCTETGNPSIGVCPTPGNPGTSVRPYDLAAFNDAHTFCVSTGACTPRDFVVPNCGASSGACAIAMDQEFLNACSVLASASWPVCQKPTMQLFFPRWDPNNPSSPDTPFLYPITAFKSPGFIVESLLTNGQETPSNDMLRSRWTQQYWTQELSYIHYCDTFFGGAFTYCDNDPLSISQRQQLCDTYEPRYVYTGMSLVAFTLEDVCPHLAFSELPSHCFVFPGDPNYGSIAQILNVKGINGRPIDWTGTTFYLVPFNLTALQNVLIDPSFADTLLTNGVQSQNLAEALRSNVDALGANGIRLLSPIIRVVNTDNFFDLHSVCQRDVPITTATIQVLYDVLLAIGNGDPDAPVYTFVQLETLGGANPLDHPYVTYTHADVFPGFSETGTRVPYDNIRIVPALTHVNIRFQPLSTLVSNTGAAVCTRFFVDGGTFELANCTFDQTGCDNIPQTQRTPIVFSGAYAQSARITNVTVINGEIAVAVLGADSNQYAYQPLINVADNILSNVSFQYTDDSLIPHQNRFVYGVYARAVGVATAAHCENTMLPPGYSRTTTCSVVKPNTDEPCLFPGACINMTAFAAVHGYHAIPNATNNPCCRNTSGTWQVVYSPVLCGQGFMCAYKYTPNGSTTDPIPVVGNRPNYRVVCSEPSCNCEPNTPCVKEVPDSDGVLECAAHGMQYTEEGAINQTWEFNQDASYAAINPLIPASAYAVGYGARWWTIDTSMLDVYPSIEGLPLVAADAASAAVVLVYVVPAALNDTDTVMYINSDSFFATLTTNPVSSMLYYNHRSAFDNLYGSDQWCVGVNASALVVTECTGSPRRFYIDSSDSRIHLAGVPFLCLATAADTDRLYVQPCAPCAVGSETHVNCATVNGVGQWFSYAAGRVVSLLDNTTYDNVTGIVRPASDRNMTLLYQNNTHQTMCLTVVTANDTLLYTPCDPCMWETNQLRQQHARLCRAATGAQQLACTRHVSSGLFATIGTPTFCGQYAAATTFDVDGQEYGIGAQGSCVSSTQFVVTKPGYGYFVYERLRILHPNGMVVDEQSLRAQTRKVYMQPYDATSFNLNSRGLQVINISEYADIFGKAVEIAVYKSSPESSTAYTIGVIVIMTIGVFVIVLNVMLIFYGDMVRKRFTGKQD